MIAALVWPGSILAERSQGVSWTGRGPEENYIDRWMGTKVGVYETTVTDNFFPCVKSSETGNRTGVCWIALTDQSGFGLLGHCRRGGT